jgi:hypothetical protein
MYLMMSFEILKFLEISRESGKKISPNIAVREPKLKRRLNLNLGNFGKSLKRYV